MRSKIRKAVTLISLLLFPITLNYFSPYVSIDGARYGIVSGSLILFMFLFLSAIFLGRAWCAWLCPIAALSDMAQGVNDKRVNVKKLKVIRYSIFTIWAAILIAMFVMAGGVTTVIPLYLTENVISVDSPVKYIVYYFVLAIFVILTFILGKRGACHSICWMSPFLVGGYKIGEQLKCPQLRVTADASKCLVCGKCDKKCPMSIPISSEIKKGYIQTSDCILCGQCIDNCTNNVLSYGIK